MNNKIPFSPNPQKNLCVEVNGIKYARYPVRTEVISQGNNISELIEKYAGCYFQKEDFIIISERAVATAQGRSIPIKNINPSFWAKFFVKFVYKNPHGIGLCSPWTMELAIREAGLWRIFLGAVATVLTKPFGLRGVFYKVAGHDINAIDGPADYVLPPGNTHAKLGPKNPMKTAQEIADTTGVEICIIDANDLGQRVMGVSRNLDGKLCEKIFADNPLGQSREQTPFAIIRRIK